MESVLVEELQATQGDGGAAARPVFDVLDEEKVLPQFFVADLIRRLVIMLGELADMPRSCRFSIMRCWSGLGLMILPPWL